MEFIVVDAVGLVAGDGENAARRVADDGDSRDFLGNVDVADLRMPVDAVLESGERIDGDELVHAAPGAGRGCACAVSDKLRFGEYLDNFTDGRRLVVVEYLAEVAVDDLLVLVQCGKAVTGFAAVQVKHALAEERINGRGLVLYKLDRAVVLAGRVETEFAFDDVPAEVLDFKSVCGYGAYFRVDVVPIACGVRFFGPKQLVADVEHLFIAELVHYFAVNFFVVTPQFETADCHRVFLGLAAVVGNLYSHGQVEFVLDGRFDAAVA